jgi:hypothetical protein
MQFWRRGRFEGGGGGLLLIHVQRGKKGRDERDSWIIERGRNNSDDDLGFGVELDDGFHHLRLVVPVQVLKVVGSEDIDFTVSADLRTAGRKTRPASEFVIEIQERATERRPMLFAYDAKKKRGEHMCARTTRNDGRGEGRRGTRNNPTNEERKEDDRRRMIPGQRK